MIFTELRFALFLVLVFVLHWSLRTNRSRKLVLLAASYAFYAAWDWRFLGLIALSTAVDFAIGRRLHATPPAREDREDTGREDRGRKNTGPENTARRRWLLGASLGVNLGLLAAFKYFNFFVESAAELVRSLGLEASYTTLSIILPVGISFYTFQTLSYTLDIYAGRIKPTRSFADFALFVAFFPQLVAGPIVRARSFLPQLETPRRLERVCWRSAFALLFSGFVKKAVIADTLDPFVDAVFADPSTIGTAQAWLGMALASAHMYCDFSGYTDTALGLGALFGYRLPKNFDYPYLAGSLTDLWRRWHITLVAWLRDYVYVPLVRRRPGLTARRVHLVTVFALCGLWHGARWTFVAWGVVHGLLLALEHIAAARGFELRRVTWRRILYVQALWMTTGVLFRAPTLPESWTYLRAMLVPTRAQHTVIEQPLFFVGLLALLALLHITFRRFDPAHWVQRIPSWAFSPLAGSATAVALACMSMDVRPYAYFQF